MARKPDVIVVTDGDRTAWKAIQDAAQDLNLYPLKASSGNPTPLGGEELVDAIEKSGKSPVVVLVDDRGDADTGPGEHALDVLLSSDRINILGVVAVASHTPHVRGVRPDFSIDSNGERIDGAVDKAGTASGSLLRGDTVDVLNRPGRRYPIVGLGDPGKMHGKDRASRGEPATLAALTAILNRDRGGPSASAPH